MKLHFLSLILVFSATANADLPSRDPNTKGAAGMFERGHLPSMESMVAQSPWNCQVYSTYRDDFNTTVVGAYFKMNEGKIVDFDPANPDDSIEYQVNGEQLTAEMQLEGTTQIHHIRATSRNLVFEMTMRPESDEAKKFVEEKTERSYIFPDQYVIGYAICAPKAQN